MQAYSADQALTNHFVVRVDGLPPLKFTKFGGPELEIKTDTLDDGTIILTLRIEDPKVDAEFMLSEDVTRTTVWKWFLAAKSGELSHRKTGTLEIYKNQIRLGNAIDLGYIVPFKYKLVDDLEDGDGKAARVMCGFIISKDADYVFPV